MTDERTASLFEPDTIVPAQYFENLRKTTLAEPEKRLMLAILEDAVNCVQGRLSAHDGRNKRISQQAEEWIFRLGGDWVFGFENICMFLGFDPEYMRQGLLPWKENKRPKQVDKVAGPRANSRKNCRTPTPSR